MAEKYIPQPSQEERLKSPIVDNPQIVEDVGFLKIKIPYSSRMSGRMTERETGEDRLIGVAHNDRGLYIAIQHPEEEKGRLFVLSLREDVEGKVDVRERIVSDDKSKDKFVIESDLDQIAAALQAFRANLEMKEDSLGQGNQPAA